MAWNRLAQDAMCEAKRLMIAKNEAKKGEYRPKNLSQKSRPRRRFTSSAC
jgi:hypothetical protein